MITISTFEVTYPLRNKRKIYDWIQTVIYNESKAPADISVILCTDEYLLEMNKKYLAHDYYTDIITFDYSEDKMVCGELFISVDRVKDNAEKEKVSIEKELMRVIIHGVLHLCGYGDKTKKQKETMRKKEDEALKLWFS